MTTLTLAVGFTWILAIGLAALLFVLSRQIRSLYDRVAPAGALTLNPVLRTGEQAPEVSARTLDGTSLTIGGPALTSRQLVVFVAPDCPISRSLAPALKALKGETEALEIVLASDGGAESEHRQFLATTALEQIPYVLSEDLGRTYGISKVPYAVLIRPGGRISAMGIVNSREHLDSLFEADRLGMASIQTFLDQHRPASAQWVDADDR